MAAETSSGPLQKGEKNNSLLSPEKANMRVFVNDLRATNHHWTVEDTDGQQPRVESEQ